MNASKPRISRTLESDPDRVDVHVVKKAEDDELPELTDDMLARATVNKGGKPVAENLVRRGELVDAFEWVSATGPFENAAYVCRRTGKIWLVSDFDDMGEEAPADVDDESLYVAVPGKKELDLGRSLALRFADEHLPDRSAEVRSYFRGPGAYANFKRVLDVAGMLEAWYAYESHGIDQALRAWAAENDIELSDETS